MTLNLICTQRGLFPTIMIEENFTNGRGLSLLHSFLCSFLLRLEENEKIIYLDFEMKFDKTLTPNNNKPLLLDSFFGSFVDRGKLKIFNGNDLMTTESNNVVNLFYPENEAQQGLRKFFRSDEIGNVHAIFINSFELPVLEDFNKTIMLLKYLSSLISENKVLSTIVVLVDKYILDSHSITQLQQIFTAFINVSSTSPPAGKVDEESFTCTTHFKRQGKKPGTTTELVTFKPGLKTWLHSDNPQNPLNIIPVRAQSRQSAIPDVSPLNVGPTTEAKQLALLQKKVPFKLMATHSESIVREQIYRTGLPHKMVARRERVELDMEEREEFHEDVDEDEPLDEPGIEEDDDDLDI
ncbi:unnamed protein product [Gordionus sp. m RMFG-2023]